MNCPNCNEYAPDNNYKCPHCGEVLHPDKSLVDFGIKPVKRKRTGVNSNLVVLLVIVVGAAILIYAAFFKGKDKNKGTNPALSTSGSGSVSVGYVVNTKNPGQEIDIQGFVKKGKTTIFDFYSEFCGPCQRISPMLQRLDSRREDIIVYKIDINRPKIRGIDWGSPAARQYNIHSIPYFLIYGPSGQLTHQGRGAYTEVMRLIKANR